jgi:hypothetical protein
MTTPDVARAEELIDAFAVAVAANAGHMVIRAPPPADAMAAREALLSLVRDLARDSDLLRIQVDVRWTKADEQITSERARAEAAEASLSRVRGALRTLLGHVEDGECDGGCENVLAAKEALASSAPGAPAEPARDDGGADEPVRVAVEVTRRTDDEGTVSFDAPGFTTVRACRRCGVLIAGGPTACMPCANAPAPGSSSSAEPIVCPRCKVKNWDRKAAEAHARWCAAPSPGAPGEEDDRG